MSRFYVGKKQLAKIDEVILRADLVKGWIEEKLFCSDVIERHFLREAWFSLATNLPARLKEKDGKRYIYGNSSDIEKYIADSLRAIAAAEIELNPSPVVVPPAEEDSPCCPKCFRKDCRCVAVALAMGI